MLDGLGYRGIRRVHSCPQRTACSTICRIRRAVFRRTGCRRSGMLDASGRLVPTRRYLRAVCIAAPARPGVHARGPAGSGHAGGIGRPAVVQRRRLSGRGDGG